MSLAVLARLRLVPALLVALILGALPLQVCDASCTEGAVVGIAGTHEHEHGPSRHGPHGPADGCGREDGGTHAHGDEAVCCADAPLVAPAPATPVGLAAPDALGTAPAATGSDPVPAREEGIAGAGSPRERRTPVLLR